MLCTALVGGGRLGRYSVGGLEMRIALVFGLVTIGMRGTCHKFAILPNYPLRIASLVTTTFVFDWS